MASFKLGQSASDLGYFGCFGSRWAPPGIEQLFAALTGCAEEAAVGFLLAECWRVGRRNSDECGIALFHISTPEDSTRADCKSVPVLYCIVSAMAPWHAQRCA
jgi:hypothetical protein